MTLQNFTLGTFAQGAAGGATAFESIATATGTGSSGTLTLSAIPGTYQHLQIRWTANDSNGIGAQLRVNGDTGSNYVSHKLFGDGASAYATGQTSRTSFDLGNAYGYNTNINAVGIIDILDYANSSKNKTIRSFKGWDNNTVGGNLDLASGLWLNTNAITSITLFSSQNFTTSTRVALYGIKGA